MNKRTVEPDLGPHRGADVVGRTAELANAMRRAGGTVVLVRVERPNVDEQPRSAAAGTLTVEQDHGV